MSSGNKKKKNIRDKKRRNSHKKYRNNNKLYPALKYTKNGEIYGYINDSGKFVIEPRFNRAYNFNDFGTAIVEDNGLMGLINASGEYVLKPTYDSISPFSDGRAVYNLGNKMGVIDEKGNRVTKKDYSFINNYSDDRAVVAITNEQGSYTYGYIDKDGKEIVPPKYMEGSSFKDDVALVKIKENQYALIDKSGNIINTYNYAYVRDYGDGLMVFGKSVGGPYGYIDKEGNIVITPMFTTANEFKDGVAVVSTEDEYGGPYGVIDKTGKFVYTPIYSEINHLGENRLALGMALNDELKEVGPKIYAIADTEGNRLTDFMYLAVGQYDDGLAYASNDEYTFFIDKSGKVDNKLPTVRGSGELKIENNLVFASIDYSPYYLDKSGKFIYVPNSTIVLSDRYSVTRVKCKPNINYLVYYPVVNGVSNKMVEEEINTKIRVMSYYIPENQNRKLCDEVTTPEKVLDFNYYETFSIEFYKKNLLVLDLEGYYYLFGAAHGMPSKKTPNIDLVTGQFYTLGDLFMGGVNWVSELNKIIENMIETDPQYEYVFKGSFTGIKPDQDFYVDENNLYIYFPPYEIGPYAAGFITFKIPFKEIQGIINKRGSFYLSFNS